MKHIVNPVLYLVVWCDVGGGDNTTQPSTSPGGGDDVGVCDRPGDRDVSVHTDDDQHHDGGRAGPDVHRQPDVAPGQAKQPLVEHRVGGAEWEHDHA